jgi:hypothetical protein
MTGYNTKLALSTHSPVGGPFESYKGATGPTPLGDIFVPCPLFERGYLCDGRRTSECYDTNGKLECPHSGKTLLSDLSVPEANTRPTVEKTEEKERQSLASYFYYNNRLYLEVRKFDGTYAFVYLDDKGKAKFTPEVIAGERIIKPRPLPQVEGRALTIVGMPDEGIACSPLLTLDELYSGLEAHFHRYVDLPHLDVQLCIFYCLFTWFYTKTNTLGYLRLRADTGKGKSRIQRVVGDVCFYPLYASGASSFSGIARQQDKWRGTLVVDESDFQGEKESQLTKYFNLGFEKGKYYILSDKQNPRRQDFFDPFCPKILAMRTTFKDNALERRLLSICPHETTDPRIPIILLSDYPERVQELRNKIALFVSHHWNDVNGQEMLSFDDLKLEPGLKQLAMPLSIIFQLWQDGAELFKQYLVARQREIKKLRSQSWCHWAPKSRHLWAGQMPPLVGS